MYALINVVDIRIVNLDVLISSFKKVGWKENNKSYVLVIREVFQHVFHVCDSA